MRLAGVKLFTLIVCVVLTASIAEARTPKTPTRPAKSTSNVTNWLESKHAGKTAARKNRRKRGQQAMKPSRVREIQAALIRNRYLKGRATGVWDERSRNAMARFQSENGWQSKVVPDSRALIKLGLGPSYAGLLNPDTALVTR